MKPLADRLWANVIRLGPDDCWLWQGGHAYDGYGRISTGRRGASPMKPHRAAYIVTFGDPPPGYHIDQTCHNTDDTCSGGKTCQHRRCCNPAHLEAVPPEINKARGKSRNAINDRKTHCKRGHEFTPENTYYRKDRPGHRHCRACARMYEHNRRINKETS